MPLGPVASAPRDALPLHQAGDVATGAGPSEERRISAGSDVGSQSKEKSFAQKRKVGAPSPAAHHPSPAAPPSLAGASPRSTVTPCTGRAAQATGHQEPPRAGGRSHCGNLRRQDEAALLSRRQLELRAGLSDSRHSCDSTDTRMMCMLGWSDVASKHYLTVLAGALGAVQTLPNLKAKSRRPLANP